MEDVLEAGLDGAVLVDVPESLEVDEPEESEEPEDVDDDSLVDGVLDAPLLGEPDELALPPRLSVL